MAIVMRMPPARGPLPDHEQKQAAIGYLHEAWAEAKLDGIDGGPHRKSAAAHRHVSGIA
jgi:hypothetical protein